MSIESDFKLNTSAEKLLVNAKVISNAEDIPIHLKLFISQADHALRRASEMVKIMPSEMSLDQTHEFEELLVQVSARVMNHPVIANNLYLRRFAQGVTIAQARHELQQFSIFAHNFDVAQATLVTNARTYDDYLRRLNVLLNEKGIPYVEGFEGELTGHWRPETVHFHWLLNMAAGLGLSFSQVGKIWLALPGTKQFVEAVFRFYANTDQSIALGAAFSLENWAANYLWTPWIAGMKKLNATLEKPVNLGYLTYHETEERHHSQTTIDELLGNFSQPWFSAQQFFEGALGMLDEGISVYYASQLKHLPDKEGDQWPLVAFTLLADSPPPAILNGTGGRSVLQSHF